MATKSKVTVPPVIKVGAKKADETQAMKRFTF